MKKHNLRILLAATCLAGGLALSAPGIAHLDQDEIAQSYRQSWFAMIALNFGPITSMLKGEMPWDDAQLKAFADQLATLANMDTARGFGPGTDKGTTRAKPEIWENKDDFNQKMDDLRVAANDLKDAAHGGDKKAIGGAVVATGKVCKACHDEYKSKDYLY